MAPDPKPRKRIRDPELLKRLHLEWRQCVCCLVNRTELRELEPEWEMSLHHVSKHPRDDLRENLVMVCGSGTTGCHGDLEHHVAITMQSLHLYILLYRRDTRQYLDEMFPNEGAKEWLARTLGSLNPDLSTIRTPMPSSSAPPVVDRWKDK